ncbi:hypothetical protein [Methylobacter tundripaludum]|uniref:Replication initiation factor n=1 Tax=Methylobacter tundripaludum (strain ATCC BAA-1195 / DSM 17260 / SV96) TaxID=697282 RepID=G3J0D3_METTV|nr:hypothetical protein [Methylobacter tundripaludum]EGW20655.1 hypothetical protein Mettu_3804 [Methylobacter tundripaludum SV96]
MKFNQRFSLESLSLGSEEDQSGLLFANGDQIIDLSGVNIVGASVDTVRQLFHGVPKASFITKLEQHVENKDEFIRLTANDLVNDDRWHFSRMGKTGGYRYKLQNNAVGLVVLFGSWYGKIDQEGSHLKIELSPHFISQRTVPEIWDYLHGDFVGISRIFLEEPEAKGVAVHLACDYQGFNLPVDFIQKFSTSSRTIRAYDGIASLDLSDFTDAVATYGREGQDKNYLIGKPIAVQMALYDKSYEMIKSDKVDYFNEEWSVYSFGTYDSTQSVRRIEARLHHTVIREIGHGLGLEFEGFNQVAEHLTDLWRYALERNRLMIDGDPRGYLNPFWQLLMQDVHFYVPAQGVKISRKKKEAVDPIARNITSVIGNLVSIMARRNDCTVRHVMRQLHNLHIWPEIQTYYRSRGKDDDDLREQIKEGLEKRRLIGRAA